MENDIEIVSETEDSVTIRKNSDGEFKVLMFTDTHLKGDKQLDNTTVTYLVKNITEQKPDLVILGGDNVTYGFNKKRNVQLAELFESLGVYWATVLGNHEGDGSLLSYMQPSGYGAYNMQSKFDAPENEWIQGCTLLRIDNDGTYDAERIFNHR